MYGTYETTAGTAALASTGVALSTGSTIAIVIALVALGGLALALRKRWINRRGPRP